MTDPSAAGVTPEQVIRLLKAAKVRFTLVGGIVRRNFTLIQDDVLYSLGEMVKNGGGAELARLVADANADRPLGL